MSLCYSEVEIEVFPYRLDAHLDCITSIRFSVRGTDKRATECGGSMSNQLTVFSS